MKVLLSFACTVLVFCLYAVPSHAQIMASLDNQFFSINTEEKVLEDTPLAGDDHTMVVIDNSIIFEALENDVVNGKLLDMFINDAPLYGEVTINDDYSFTYIPKKGTCEMVDSFSYIVTNQNGKDKATVYVDVICEEITIINGFSPDGDGFNDAFTIIGCEKFPNNTLYIFNQWGEELFHIKNYTNDWNGEGLEKEMYFYIFEDGKGDVYSGYVNIN